ncbi:MAG: MBOAT family protein [Pseudomonadota bacterium]
MLFVELRFFLFFGIVFSLAWLLRSNNARKLLLTGASYIFYGAWDWRFLGLILLVTLTSYIVGLASSPSAKRADRRKPILTAGIIMALGVLALFKYFNFFTESFADFAGLVGLPSGQITLSLVLPVGISFYTFQAISYMVDVYRGQIAPREKFSDVAFYIAFFPQLVAGPIVRASHFVPQMETTQRWADVPVRAALVLFLIGFIKKACISDNVAPYVDLVFETPESFSALALIGGVLLYGVQIYCDFSGYSDMAIALAALLGYHFPKNFDAPYLSPDIQEFWRRWHISLSTWLRDYLYIPLGGNRRGNMRRDVNLMTTMLLGGLWHGASFIFVIWGGLHGGALIVERTWNKLVAQKFKPMGVLGRAIGIVVTVYWVHLAWIFFRAPNLSDSLAMAKTYLTFQSAGTEQLPIAVWPLIFLLAAVHAIGYPMQANDRLAKLSPVSFTIFLGVASAVALSFVPLGYRPFIYFQF